MPLTAKQLRPLSVRVRAVSGVWMWVSGGIYFLSSILSEQIGVGTCIQKHKDKLLIAYLPNKQPVGLNVTFPLPLTVACQDVGMILFFELFAVE